MSITATAIAIATMLFGYYQGRKDGYEKKTRELSETINKVFEDRE